MPENVGSIKTWSAKLKSRHIKFCKQNTVMLIVLRENLALQDINTTRKNSKQSGIVAIDSCFALSGARQYGVTTRKSWISSNKPRMVATFFLQQTTAFILFLIVPSLQISCFRKTREKQYAKYDLKKRIAARLIWQLVIHSCVIFACIISRRDGENNGFLAGVSLPPSLRAPRVSLAPKTPI